jgi:hypothetical protein
MIHTFFLIHGHIKYVVALLFGRSCQTCVDVAASWPSGSRLNGYDDAKLKLGLSARQVRFWRWELCSIPRNGGPRIDENPETTLVKVELVKQLEVDTLKTTKRHTCFFKNFQWQILRAMWFPLKFIKSLRRFRWFWTPLRFTIIGGSTGQQNGFDAAHLHILACLKNGNWTQTGHFSGENDDWPWFTMIPWFINKLWLIVSRQKHFLLPIVAGPKSQWLPAPLDRSFEPVRLLDAKSIGSHIFGVQETWFPVDLPLNVLNQSIEWSLG